MAEVDEHFGDVPEGVGSSFPEVPGRIYVINTLSFFKIGKTAGDPEERRKQLAPGCPFELSVVHTFACSDMGWAEDHLHRVLRNSNIRGEWFHLDLQHQQWLFSITRSADKKLLAGDIDATYPNR